MCGIAGIYGNFSLDRKQEMLATLSSRLSHRGPDGCGYYVENDKVGLTHTRLSIIDLSECGNQPLYNEDRSIVLICNGEIYNYIAIRKELITKGHIFSSNSDSEVILHLYEESPDNFNIVLDKLVGMFAFALWDTNRKRLLVARDRIGIKPLYYYHNDGSFIFASEVKAIACIKSIKITTDYTSLYEYFLLGSIPGPNTLYNEIKALEAGHYISISNNNFSINKYWDIPAIIKEWKNEQEIVEHAETLLNEVIKDHLVADVPVGTFLSAGVDSSLITSIAAQYHPGIYSFTASFPGEPEDEGEVAKNIANHLKITPLFYSLEGDFFKGFSQQFENIDQPFAIASALSLGRISHLAKRHVKVVLSGDGGDELFAGYHRHILPFRPDFLKIIPSSLHNVFLKSIYKISGKEKFERLRKHEELSDGVKYLSKIFVANGEDILPLFPKSIATKIDTNRYVKRVEQCFDFFPQNDYINKMLYVDFKTTLVDEMLTKCDRMTMINGVEGRVPLLDHRIVEFAFTIPSKYKRNGKVGKTILREILKKYQGDEIAYREKTGFNSPLKKWLNDDENTRRFALENIVGLSKKEVLDKKSLNEISNDITKYRPELIFALICLNNYYNAFKKEDAKMGVN